MPNYKDFDLDVQKGNNSEVLWTSPTSRMGAGCESLNNTCYTYNTCTKSYCQQGSCMLDTGCLL